MISKSWKLNGTVPKDNRTLYVDLKSLPDVSTPAYIKLNLTIGGKAQFYFARFTLKGVVVTTDQLTNDIKSLNDNKTAMSKDSLKEALEKIKDTRNVKSKVKTDVESIAP